MGPQHLFYIKLGGYTIFLIFMQLRYVFNDLKLTVTTK